MDTTIYGDVSRYFAGTLGEHGASACGVGWNGDAAQTVRFDQLLRVIDTDERFSINDVGCGYGALLDYLNKLGLNADYRGIDICPDMVKAAEERFPSAEFVCGTTPAREADYSVSSGIFNLRMGRSDAEFRDYIETTVDIMASHSRRGFSFNCLTTYSDPPKMREDLYYADPCAMFDLCKRRYSRNVTLLHDYGIYDFTIVVRHD